MAKSTGNIARVGELLDAGVSPRALRYALIAVHYRARPRLLGRVARRGGAARRAARRAGRGARVVPRGPRRRPGARRRRSTRRARRSRAALDDDLNISAALAAVFDLVRDLNRRIEARTLSTADAGRALAIAARPRPGPGRPAGRPGRSLDAGARRRCSRSGRRRVQRATGPRRTGCAMRSPTGASPSRTPATGSAGDAIAADDPWLIGRRDGPRSARAARRKGGPRREAPGRPGPNAAVGRQVGVASGRTTRSPGCPPSRVRGHRDDRPRDDRAPRWQAAARRSRQPGPDPPARHERPSAATDDPPRRTRAGRPRPARGRTDRLGPDDPVRSGPGRAAAAVPPRPDPAEPPTRAGAFRRPGRYPRPGRDTGRPRRISERGRYPDRWRPRTQTRRDRYPRPPPASTVATGYPGRRPAGLRAAADGRDPPALPPPDALGAGRGARRGPSSGRGGVRRAAPGDPAAGRPEPSRGAREARAPRDQPADPDRRGRGRVADGPRRLRRSSGRRARRRAARSSPRSTTSSPVPRERAEPPFILVLDSLEDPAQRRLAPAQRRGRRRPRRALPDPPAGAAQPVGDQGLGRRCRAPPAVPGRRPAGDARATSTGMASASSAPTARRR